MLLLKTMPIKETFVFPNLGAMEKDCLLYFNQETVQEDQSEAV